MTRPTRLRTAAGALALVVTLAAGTLSATQVTTPPDTAPYCAVETRGTTVDMVRPQPTDAPSVIDDVNWFARPVPNPDGHWMVAYASHNLNYLYDLTTGRRVRIPDASDAVATPDGRFMTVPSHYTSTDTVNFYDLPTLLDHLERGEDADGVEPVFAHAHPDLDDVYYQSVGIVSTEGDSESDTTVYRMMFSGGNHPTPPGFRVVDYEIRRRGDAVVVRPSAPMKLCPQIVKDMATPFISKDGRYVAAHDDGYPDRPASLKIFEITDVQPDAGTTTCALRVDFGFAAGKSDFSFDGSMLTFHISKHAYLTPFVDGGLRSPTITDVVVVDLQHDDDGRLVGHGGMARITTSQTEGVGSYFPAFMPDGRIFYIANATPRDSADAKRYELRVVNPHDELRMANVFLDDRRRRHAATIGELWRATCAPDIEPFKEREAEWSYFSLTSDQCRRLVETHWASATPSTETLLDACGQ